VTDARVAVAPAEPIDEALVASNGDALTALTKPFAWVESTVM